MAKVLVYSPPIGKSMAGPSIRCWEFAKALSKDYDITLVSSNKVDIQGEGFNIVSKTDPRIRKLEAQAQVMIGLEFSLQQALAAKKNGTKLILDAYAPNPLEMFELHKYSTDKIRHKQQIHANQILTFNFKMADAIICASHKQRDLWLGWLISKNLITPSQYRKDPDLLNFIEIVPFGLSDNSPHKTGPGFREKFGFSQNDFVIVWGGGIWNWFDPISLIKAMKILSHKRNDIKLVFLGIRSPDPGVAEMKIVEETITLSKKLELLDKSVFFNYGWIPYNERQNYLLDANIGISIHPNTLETRFSFRTRILDYIWAQLPIISTEGDSFADLIKEHNLGKVVTYQSPEDIANKILMLLENRKEVEQIKSNLASIQQSFQWNSVIEPLKKLIDHSISEKKAVSMYSNYKASAELIYYKFKVLGFTTFVAKVFRKIYKDLFLRSFN